MLLNKNEAQIPKEGTGTMTLIYRGTYKALPIGQERLQMSYEIMGVIIGDTSDVLFHNASVRCLGALHAVKGESNNNGFCVGTRPDGDQIFLDLPIYWQTGSRWQGIFHHGRWHREIHWHTWQQRVYGCRCATRCRRNLSGDTPE